MSASVPAALRDAALAAMHRAYAPYSHFRVGAALLARDGRVFAGCNVENASYPVTICAERVALGAAVAAGVREFDAVVVVTEAQTPTPPCGMCRQALVEFSPALTVWAETTHGATAHWTLDALLTDPFTPARLGADR